MNCEEFLKQFREALDGKVPEHIIQDNIEYYSSYIKERISDENSESDVLGELGDPRLLAKTIEESNKFAQEGYKEKKEYDTSQSGSIFGQDRSGFGSHIKIPMWIIICLLLLACFVIMRIAFRVVIYFMPVILLLLLTWYVCRIVRDWINNR